NGAVYNGNMTMLYQVLPAREGENYVMPETVENIDTYAFWNLQNTKNVKISSKVAGIPRQAMSSMGSVENVVIQEPTTGIGERAVANNANLKQVVIPDSVVTIDKKAFSGSPEFKICTSKSSTADTFGKENGIEVIYKADEYPDDFMDSNAGLEQKPNVGGSSDRDGSDTNSSDEDENETSQTTTAVTSDDDTSSDDENSDKNNNDNKNNTTQHKPSEFESAANYIHPLDVPEKDNVLGKTVIVAGKAVVLMDNHKGQVYGIPDGTEADVVEEDSTEDETQSNPDKTENSISVSYERSDEDSIAQRKFYKQKDLTEIEIEENIKRIGRLAFAESGLKSVVIPENVTEIEYGAFMSCANLKEVTIPDTVSAIGTKAFEGTPWLKQWLDSTDDSEGGDFLIVGDGILLAYKGSAEHVVIPDGVKQIGSEALKGHKEILDVAVPASVEKICAEAFRNCSSLTGLTGCEGLKTVVRGAFYGTQISEDDFKK
ncbi:MAG: leucine-rich repeat domain-containing protein, partial [Lachnospiraceae bacterium]|nr:leucine-rich repeat domain-containing protein [Lachnospiraceae bacterium]